MRDKLKKHKNKLTTEEYIMWRKEYSGFLKELPSILENYYKMRKIMDEKENNKK